MKFKPMTSTSASVVPYQMSYQANWELVTLCDLSYIHLHYSLSLERISVLSAITCTATVVDIKHSESPGSKVLFLKVQGWWTRICGTTMNLD